MLRFSFSKGKFVDKEAVSIAYDGSAVKHGAMDARDLAPALLAISDLLEDANRLFNGQRSKLQVKIKSDINAGSFEINLEIVQTVLETVQTLVATVPPYSAKRILEIVGFFSDSGISLIKILKWSRGKQITKTTILKNGYVQLETDQRFDTLEVSGDSFKLYMHPPARKSIENVIAPLKSDGVDCFEARNKRTGNVETIYREEVPYFDYPEEERETLETTEQSGEYELIDVSFAPEHKWRLSDGTISFTATLADEEFLGLVESRDVSFASGDAIRAIISREQYRVNTRLRSNYRIIKVIEHKAGLSQIPIDIPGR